MSGRIDTKTFMKYSQNIETLKNIHKTGNEILNELNNNLTKTVRKVTTNTCKIKLQISGKLAISQKNYWKK